MDANGKPAQCERRQKRQNKSEMIHRKSKQLILRWRVSVDIGNDMALTLKKSTMNYNPTALTHSANRLNDISTSLRVCEQKNIIYFFVHSYVFSAEY